MGVVFTKTQKGHEEIETKSHGLSPRVRRALIFVDGKRTVDDLRSMLQSDDLQHTLGVLEEEGYIEVATVINATGQATAPAEPLPPINAFRNLPTESDPVALQKARNFMLNTLNAFVGSLGASSLLERIDQCHDHAGLRTLFDEWYHAIIMSREGKREAEALRAKLLEVI